MRWVRLRKQSRRGFPSGRKSLNPPAARRPQPRVTAAAQAVVKAMPISRWRRRAVLDLARKMDLHRQEIDRLLDLNHATNLAKIEQAFAALGKTLDIPSRTRAKLDQQETALFHLRFALRDAVIVPRIEG